MDSIPLPPQPEDQTQAQPEDQTPPQPASPGPAGEPARPPSLQDEVVRKPSLVYRFFHWLLGSDSAVGRFMRPFLRIISTVIGLFSLGLLAGFFLFYLPTQAQLDTARGELVRRDQTIQDLQGQGKTAQDAADAIRRQLTASATDLKIAQSRNQLLVVINDIATARMQLALKDGAKAMDALEKGKTDLALLLPGLSEKDPAAAGEIKSRLDLMTSVLVRDPALAQSDLDNLYTALTAIQDKLFK